MSVAPPSSACLTSVGLVGAEGDTVTPMLEEFYVCTGHITGPKTVYNEEGEPVSGP